MMRVRAFSEDGEAHATNVLVVFAGATTSVGTTGCASPSEPDTRECRGVNAACGFKGVGPCCGGLRCVGGLTDPVFGQVPATCQPY
jgi:hypothetical protein